MKSAAEAVQAARRQVRAAACRVLLAELALADMAGPDLARAEAELDAAAVKLAAAVEELTAEKRQAGGLLL